MALIKRCKHEDISKCRCAFWYIFELHGKRYSRSTRTANRQVAGRIEERRRIAVLDNKDEAPKKVLLFSAHITDYVAHTKLHNRTAYKDQATLDRVLAIVVDRPLKDVSPFHIEKWKQQRANDVSKATVNRELNIVRGCFARAVEWERLPKSPLRTVKGYEIDDTRIRVIDDDELKRVLTCNDPFVTLICRTTLECLPRLSEVLGIHKDHMGPGWIEFRRKGGRMTRAAVPVDLRTALVARMHATSGFVFGEGTKGLPPSEQSASNRIAKKLKALGITGASHHTMRHTGVTLMLEHGVNPRVIQLLAGWSSLRMLERYGHARDTEIQRAVNENAAHLAGLEK